ncbi:MAG: hypothetical protein ACFFAA_11840 [Promethearchaeota archaeon]
MSAEEKFKSIIQDIKDIYIYLTQGEPTPDDEITAREKLINQIKVLKSVKTSKAESNEALFEETLNKLDKWDTLELWFLESELPEYIEKIIKITDQLPEFEAQSTVKESPTARLHEDLETASYDIDQIVNKVSEQFKGEIDNLKHKIDALKVELEKKDEALQQVSHGKVIKKIIPKKEVKLPPPKIKLPVFKKPVHPPQIKSTSKTEREKPKIANGIKMIEQVQTKIEKELERLKQPAIFEQKSEIEEDVIQEQQEGGDISENPKELESILDIIEESETPSKPLESPNFTELPEKPKKGLVIPEIIEIESSREEKRVPFTLEEIEKSLYYNVEESKTNEESPSFPKPKVSAENIEEIEAEEIRSTGTELFNVFSSVGEKPPEKLPTLNEAINSTSVKEKKKKKEEKGSTMAFVGFNDSKVKTSKIAESETDIEEELPSDKDTLYQELIALEGKRYSLEKTFKELEKAYSMGSLDDFDYKKQGDELRGRLNGITSKINKIRRVISSL